MTKHGLRYSSFVERPFNRYIITTMKPHKAHTKVARDKINKTLYKNETNFKFEKYVIKLKRIFNVLENYGVQVHED